MLEAALAIVLVVRGVSLRPPPDCIPSASRCAWSEQPLCAPSVVVDNLDAGKLGHKAIELVIAPSTESIAWSDPYDSIRTAYIHPEARNPRVPPSHTWTTTRGRAIKVPNMGSEQYSCAGSGE